MSTTPPQPESDPTQPGPDQTAAVPQDPQPQPAQPAQDQPQWPGPQYPDPTGTAYPPTPGATAGPYPGSATSPPPPPSSPSPWTDASTALQDQRSLGSLAHIVPLVAMVASAGLLGFVASIGFYIYAKDRGDFARTYAANSLNVQIIVGIGSVLSFPLMLLLIGFLTLPLVLLYGVVVHIIAAIKASNGELWTPPLMPRFVR